MKKKQKNKTIWVILVVVALFGVLLAYGVFKSKGTESMIQANFYDSDGNLIDQSNTLSIVENVPGVDKIDLTITLTNIGDEPLSCDIISASPTAFNSALTKTTKTLPKDGKVAWTSSLIDVAQFESQTESTTFSAVVRCSYNTGTGNVNLDDKIGSLSLFIRPEIGTTDFEVSIDLGGTGTEYCGDGTCQTDEDANTCPNDCAISTSVNFRASDISYPSGSAVAYSESCGSDLIAYGYVSSGSSSSTGIISCQSYLDTVIMEVPCSLSDTCYLGIKSSSPTRRYICWSESSSLVKYKYYLESDSDASKVDTSPISFDSAKELPC